LMQLLEQGAYMRGHDRVLLTVIAQNTAARRLYQRLGYRPTGHTCNGSITRAGSKASKIEMYKELRA